jgi:hypothetical protein
VILKNIAVRTENGFMAPVSAWEQNITVETATALSRVLPRSRVYIFARRHGGCPESFRGPKSLQFQVQHHELGHESFLPHPSQFTKRATERDVKQTNRLPFCVPSGFDKVLAESLRAGTHQGVPQTCTKICYESGRAGFRSSNRR